MASPDRPLGRFGVWSLIAIVVVVAFLIYLMTARGCEGMDDETYDLPDRDRTDEPFE